MVTGTNTYQELFQGLLAERVIANGEDSLVEVMKLTGDSQVTLLNSMVPTAYDYIDLIYTGSNISRVTFKQGGSAGVTVATLLLTYDSSDNLTTVTRT